VRVPPEFISLWIVEGMVIDKQIYRLITLINDWDRIHVGFFPLAGKDDLHRQPGHVPFSRTAFRHKPGLMRRVPGPGVPQAAFHDQVGRRSISITVLSTFTKRQYCSSSGARQGRNPVGIDVVLATGKYTRFFEQFLGVSEIDRAQWKKQDDN